MIFALDLREDCDLSESSAVALVIAGLVHLVGKSRGSMTQLDSGVIEFRLATGEIFHLDEETVTRVA